MLSNPRYLLCIPTFNEAENISEIIDRVLSLRIENLELLIIDDNSPDGTAEIVEKRFTPSQGVHILKREMKAGLGPAYLAGFQWGLKGGFDFLIEMDADGSHQPEQLPALIAASEEADLVLGTRWMPGGVVENWPLSRRLISQCGTRYAQFALKLPYRDLTGGFRVISKVLLSTVDISTIETIGYGFQVEVALRAAEKNLRIIEVPITFIERTRGKSKMSKEIVLEALLKTTQWGLQRRVNRR